MASIVSNYQKNELNCPEQSALRWCGDNLHLHLSSTHLHNNRIPSLGQIWDVRHASKLSLSFTLAVIYLLFISSSFFFQRWSNVSLVSFSCQIESISVATHSSIGTVGSFIYSVTSVIETRAQTHQHFAGYEIIHCEFKFSMTPLVTIVLFWFEIVFHTIIITSQLPFPLNKHWMVSKYPYFCIIN